MLGIFPSQRRERTAHGVADKARAAPWMSSKKGSDWTRTFFALEEFLRKSLSVGDVPEDTYSSTWFDFIFALLGPHHFDHRG
jgi:hypothetical protein